MEKGRRSTLIYDCRWRLKKGRQSFPCRGFRSGLDKREESSGIQLASRGRAGSVGFMGATVLGGEKRRRPEAIVRGKKRAETRSVGLERRID